MEKEGKNDNDSESDRGSVVDDSDMDPDYTAESSEVEISDEELFPPECKEDRPAKPSALRPLNLSEGESSSENEVSDRPLDLDQPSTSSYFPHSSQTKSENTNYDFSQILHTQRKLMLARIEHSKQSLPANEAPLEKLTETCNINELLAQGEKSSNVHQESFSDSESEGETQGPQTITITLPNELNSQMIHRLEKHLQVVKREYQINLHKVHLLCIIAHGNYFNAEVINNDVLPRLILSTLPLNLIGKPFTSVYIGKLVKWFTLTFPVDKNPPFCGEISYIDLEYAIHRKRFENMRDAVALFVALLRALGMTARVVISFQPAPLRVSNIPELKVRLEGKKASPTKPSTSGVSKATMKRGKSAEISKESMSKKSSLSSKGHPSKQLSSAKGISSRKVSKPQEKQVVSKKSSSLKKVNSNKSTTPKDVGPGKKTKSAQKETPLPKTLEEDLVELLTSDESEETRENKKKKPIGDYWLEVYLEVEEKWICVDLTAKKVLPPSAVYARLTKPVKYIVGWQNDNTLKDITRRYVNSWMIKNRVDENWWTQALKPFRGEETLLDKKEDEFLDHQEEGAKALMPTSIAGFKDHPLFALKRHLLKFEAIYPPDAVPLGFVRGEPVFSRFCIQELFSREKWLRKGKCVRVNETPYKIVKSRSKLNKLPGENKPLELFGHWQVEDYIAPPAVDGKVPRNEYGNVEVYTPSMLPAGTVHLQVPGILKVARKMDIDCAPAVIGWEHHSGRSHPVIDGIVVCKEFQDILMDAWNIDFDASAVRSNHKRKQSAYNKWWKFVKFVTVKANINKKYKTHSYSSETDEEPPAKLQKK